MKMTALLVGGALVALGHGAAHAETETQQPAASATQLQDIIVTARKRAESVQKVPIAVSVASGEALAQHQVADAYQLTSITPSLQVESRFGVVGAVNFSIRGLGTAIFGPQIESSVGVVIDDVAMSRPQFGIMQFVDLDRVEVLRGPQGMLFGKNASAGVVNIVTASPVLGRTEGFGRIQYSHQNTATSGNQATAEGVVNLPVSENSALRTMIFVSRQDGFARNVTRKGEDLGLTQFGGRLKYRYEPSDRFNLLLTADYIHADGPLSSVLIRRKDAPGGFIATLNAIDGVTASTKNLLIASDAPNYYKSDVGGISAKAEIELANDFILTNIAAYRAFEAKQNVDTDSSSFDVFNFNNYPQDYRQWSNELRLTSPSDRPLTFQLGLFYLNLRAHERTNQGANLRPALPPPPAGFRFNLGNDFNGYNHTVSYAGFAEGQLRIADDLRLTAGGRFTYDDLEYHMSAVDNGATAPLGVRAVKGDHVHKSNFSYRVGLDYNLTPDILSYATYARGYKSPTFDTVFVTRVREEIPKSFELGLKSTLFDRRLRLNIALFDTKFEGFQTQVLAGTLAYRTLNAGSLKSRGLEAEFTLLAAPGLTLSGGVTYNDSKYQNLVGVPCYAGQPSGTTGTNVCFPNGSTDVSGNQLQNAPKWTSSFTARYETSLSSGWNGFLQGELYHRSSFRFSQTLDPQTRVSPNAVLSASIGAESTDNRLSLSLFVKNLTDKRIPSLILPDPVAPAYGDFALGGDYWHQFTASSFRTIGLTLTFRP